MNFKRLRGIAAVAFTTIAAALLAGCMNSMAGSVDGGASRGVATLHLSATGIPEEYAAEFQAYNDRQNSRSILPNDPFKIENGLSFVLTGQNEAGVKYGPEEVVLASTADVDGGYDFKLNDGSSVTMDAMSWILTLTAYKTDDDGNYDTDKPVLIGHCSVDLRNGSGTAKFKMGIAGLKTKAAVSISGDVIDGKDLVASCTAGIYRKIDLADVGGTESDVLLTANGTKKSFTFTASSVTPGIYLYIMKFYKDSTKTEIVGSYTDTIVINPGNDMTITGLELDCIDEPPTEPANLKATLVPNSESSDGSTYQVKLTWEQAKYVTNYELNLVESASDGSDLDSGNDGTAIANGQIYGMASMDKENPKTIDDFTNSDVFSEDSSYMVYGDSSCVLELETGKVYEVQLRARNYIGTSKWVDRVKSTDTDGYDAPTAQHINRMYVSYNMNGGKLQLSAGGNPKRGTYVVYYSWKTNQSLLPVGENADDNKVTNDAGVSFESWLLEGGTAVYVDTDGADTETSTRETKVTKYTYKNARVKASYGNKVSASVTQEEPIRDIDIGDIEASLLDANGADMTMDGNGNNYTAKKLDANGKPTSIRIFLNKASADFTSDTTEYTNVKVEAWVGDYKTAKEEIAMNAAYGQFDVSTSKYTSGRVLSIMVTADTRTKKGLSQTLTFRLE